MRSDERDMSGARDARGANSAASGAIRSFDDIIAAQDARRAANASNSAASQNLANPQVSRDSRAPQVASTMVTAPAHKTRIIGHYGGFRKTISFAYVCLVYHATTLFCERLYSYKNDPLGKTSGQMVGAARSARQNIVEGSSRAGTSKETELRLYDVAKGSLEELAGDYEAFLIDRGVAPWSENDPRFVELARLRVDAFTASEDSRHRYGEYLLAMRQRFAPWLEAEDPEVAANAILFAIDRASALLHRQMASVGEGFVEEGGFTERLSKARLETRDAKVAEDGAPSCPRCNGPMRKMVARKGRNAGKPFWSCRNYPNCKGTRPWGGSRWAD